MVCVIFVFFLPVSLCVSSQPGSDLRTPGWLAGIVRLSGSTTVDTCESFLVSCLLLCNAIGFVAPAGQVDLLVVFVRRLACRHCSSLLVSFTWPEKQVARTAKTTTTTTAPTTTTGKVNHLECCARVSQVDRVERRRRRQQQQQQVSVRRGQAHVERSQAFELSLSSCRIVFHRRVRMPTPSELVGKITSLVVAVAVVSLLVFQRLSFGPRQPN